MAEKLSSTGKDAGAVNPNTLKEVLPMADKTQLPTTAAALAAANVDPDLALYEAVIENPKTGSRSTDEHSAFTMFRDFTHRMLKVALKKGASAVRVGRLIQGAVDHGIFNEVQPADQRYRRGYNYFTQQKKSLPDGWIVKKVNGKNHVVFNKPLPPSAKV